MQEPAVQEVKDKYKLSSNIQQVNIPLFNLMLLLWARKRL